MPLFCVLNSSVLSIGNVSCRATDASCRVPDASCKETDALYKVIDVSCRITDASKPGLVKQLFENAGFKNVKEEAVFGKAGNKTNAIAIHPTRNQWARRVACLRA